MQESRSLAVFCDFENIALGVKEARYAQFDMERVLERLLAKGSIVVKKAYCDWERYKEFKIAMHAAAFELIEIPHLRQSGKNSADIRMVVDALDLCYTKEHVDTFVIVSGDSDFSPLVSKLRENAKTVIGVGVKNSSSGLLIANCDEFIYYDDLIRQDEQKRRAAIAHATYSPEVRHPVEVGADQEQHLVAWLSKRLGVKVRAPKLEEAGLALVGGRLLPGESGPVAHFMYQTQNGRRLTMYVRAEPSKNRDTAFRYSRENNVSVFYWIDRDCGYALASADLTREELLRVATLVYKQLEP